MKRASTSGDDSKTSSASGAISKPERIESLDIYRGFVMLLMMSLFSFEITTTGVKAMPKKRNATSESFEIPCKSKRDLNTQLYIM
jgi:hypothetical protein